MAEEKAESASEARQIVPPVDIYETPNEVVLVADMPGITKENLTLDVDNNELTISGTFEERHVGEKKLIDECVYGRYHRTFALSDIIDYGKISAKLDNGVLTVTLPKHERVKPKKIVVETE